MKKKKIIITGGSGRFGSILKSIKSYHAVLFPKKKELNILNEKSILSYLKKKKPDIIIHLAGLSRPMDIHEKQINHSIDLNIIGTANIVKVCSEFKIKIIYFSTHYVYPCKKGNYSEKDSLLPINNYAWSKLGGESSVQMYKNSLILRVCMTEKPFVHKKAFKDIKTNFIFHEDVAQILYKNEILNLKGVLNIGGNTKTIYNFAKKFNSKIIPISKKNSFFKSFPNPSINIKKLKRIQSKS